jgi:6-phosphofructokinase 1
MGRDCGYLASSVGLASGAEVIVVPELPSDPEAVAQDILAGAVRGKHHAVVIVAEGAKHDAEALAQHFHAHRERLNFDFRVCRLGHVQRGGAPGFADRLLATRLGAAAAETLARGEHGMLLGVVRGDVVATPLEQVAQRTNPLDPAWLAMAHALAQ